MMPKESNVPKVEKTAAPENMEAQINEEMTTFDEGKITSADVSNDSPCAGLCDCMLQLYELITSTQSKQPTLIRAELFTLTGDADNKDKDTGIFVSVKTSDETMLLADISNADSSGKDATTYNDDSYHIVPLSIDSPGATKSQCAQFKVHMSIKTNGNDNWSIDLARVTLFFSDGTNLVADRANFSLTNDGASTDFQSP